MPADDKSIIPEREHTDESLRTEREKTDLALLNRQALVEDNADVAVLRARENADAVLTAARDKADEQPATSVTTAATVDERAVADEVVRDERATADEAVRQEREENARALATLLPLEREKTNRYLLTERARSDDALSHRDDFLGIVSHDLRNLLGGIVMNASLAAHRASKNGDDEIQVVTARIQRYAARMNRLIGDLVDVASIDAGKLAFEPASGDAAALIAEALDTFQASASAGGVALLAEMAERPLVATFDHGRILQVLANLITNAIKFTPQGGAIRIQGEGTKDELRISVSDTGAGIPDNMLDVIFERFWQVGKNDRRGLGLGLYISRSIVEFHGGKIWAESNPGQGSKFSFTLPRHGSRA